MLFDDSDDDDELGIDVVTDWISQNPIFFTDLNLKKPKRRRFGRDIKFDYWGSNWGQLLRDSTVNDPTSESGKIFRRRFR